MKNYFILFLSVLLAAQACTIGPAPEYEDGKSPGSLITITAKQEAEDCTRTVRVESDGSVKWVPGDQISLFYGSGENGGSLLTSDATETCSLTTFTGPMSTGTGGSGQTSLFWGLYPYDSEASCDGASITTTLSGCQTATPGTFANGTFPSIGKSTGLTMGFYHICGGIRFSVSKEGITRAILKGNNGEKIAGKVRVGFSASDIPVIEDIIDGIEEIVLETPYGYTFEKGRNYYFTIIPTVFTKGFTITFETRKERGVFSRTASTEIKRSVFTGQKDIDKDINNWAAKTTPEYVDLGLSVKWASFNVGATKPEETGDYFAWGETEPKPEYSWSTYKWCNGSSISLTKYCTNPENGCNGFADYKNLLDDEDDAAAANWGESWRMPTEAEWTELKDNCTWTRTENYNGTGVAGQIVTSNKPGYENNSIFLPDAGDRYGTNLSFWSGAFNYHSRNKKGGCNGECIRPVFGHFVHVASISIPAELEIPAGTFKQLEAYILPSNATDPSVQWVSSNESVATISNTGKVKARMPGLTTITVFASNGLSATCSLSVREASDDDIAGAYSVTAKDYYDNSINWEMTLTREADDSSIQIDFITAGSLQFPSFGDWSYVGQVSEDKKTITFACGQKCEAWYETEEDQFMLCSWEPGIFIYDTGNITFTETAPGVWTSTDNIWLYPVNTQKLYTNFCAKNEVWTKQY